jgi:ABC-2 type transport system ATP-binding protein
MSLYLNHIMATIEIQNACKNYGQNKAVNNVSFSVPENCLFGLIGPDGAGKTTLFRMITTLLLPDRGNITVFGQDTNKDFHKIRLFTGYMPGRFSLYPDLTVQENLEFYATIFGTTMKQHYKLIEPVYSLLEPYNRRLVRNLSGGMKQKLALSCALIHNPRLLVLDEPTTGVDAVSRKEFWDTLQVLKNTGMTILVSTPYMDEAVRCEKVALMQQGVIMVTGNPLEILKDFGSSLFEIRATDRFGLLQLLRTLNGVKSAYLFGQCIHVTTESDITDPAWLQKNLTKQGMADARITRIPADFEDCFIEAVEHTHTTKEV